eukprot:4577327-Lingulodinium_polyedra.AAC.1
MGCARIACALSMDSTRPAQGQSMDRPWAAREQSMDSYGQIAHAQPTYCLWAVRGLPHGLVACCPRAVHGLSMGSPRIA